MGTRKTKGPTREPLTSDLIFKAVFGQDTEESKKALIAVLNLILEREEDPITDLVYKNPFSIPEVKNQKEIIMDIRVETSGGELIDVEMQMELSGDYFERIVLYGCKMAAKGLDRGQEYVKMKKSILITFVGNRMPSKKANEQVHSMFTLQEETTHERLSDALEFHFIELGKIPWKEKSPDKLDPLQQFGAYLSCSGDPEQQDYVERLVQCGGEVISMTDKLLRKISEDERIREARFDREWYEIEMAWRRSDVLREGRAEGLEKGLEKGRAEGLAAGEKNKQAAIALEMKRDGMSAGKISRYTGLSEAEIEAL